MNYSDIDPRIDSLLDQLLELPSSERESFLDDSCGDDAHLRDTLERLLTASESPDSVIKPGGALLPAFWEGLVSERVDPGRLPAGARVGAYRIVRPIGRGGMATVYLAQRDDGQFEQQVALKILEPSGNSTDLIQRFEQERQILASLQHSNIARLLDGGITSTGEPYVAMDYIDGDRIDIYCDTNRLSIKARLKLFLKIVSAVQYAHKNLVVHRDIKPANILVDRNGEPKLLDFGIAKLLDSQAMPHASPATRSSVAPMTPEYASPEQILGEPVTTASDVYQLGHLFYLLIAARSPYRFEKLSHAGTVEAICRQDPIPPSTAVMLDDSEDGIPDPVMTSDSISRDRSTTTQRLAKILAGDLDNVALMALRKEASRRYESAGDLGADIERYLRAQPLAARPSTINYRLSKFINRHAIGVAISVLAIIGTAVGAAFYTVRITSERNRAELEAQKAEQVSDFLTRLFRVSDPSEARGALVTARELLDRGAERIEDELAEQPDVKGSLLSTIGQTYFGLGLYESAEQTLSRAVDLQRSVHGADHRDTLSSLNHLGNVYRARGQYGRAETLLREVYLSRRHLDGDEHPQTLAVLNNVGLSVWRQGKFDEAEVIFAQVLDARQRILGEDHPDVVHSVTNLANVRFMRGDYSEAAAAYARSIELGTRVLGEDHPSTMDALNNLAMTYEQQLRLEEAGALLDKVIGLRSRVLGPAHARTLSARHNLATVQWKMGRHEAAHRQFEDVLDSRRQVLGSDHPETLWSQRNLAGVYRDLGCLEDSENLYRETLQTRSRILGPMHPDTLNSRQDLAELLEVSKRYEEAEALIREALHGYRVTQDGGTDDIFRLESDLGQLLMKAGRLEESEQLLASAVEGVRESLPNEYLLLSQVLARYGRTLVNMKEYDRAETVLTDGLEALSSSQSTATRQAESDIAEQLVDLYEQTGNANKASKYRDLLR